MSTQQHNKIRKTFSLRQDIAAFLAEQAAITYDGNESACVEHMVEFYRASKQGPLSEFVYHQARVQRLFVDHGLVAVGRRRSLGVDWVLPDRRLGVEAKLRVPENTIGLTAALTATHVQGHVDGIWIVLPDTSTQGDLARWNGYVGRLPFSGVQILKVAQADRILRDGPGEGGGGLPRITPDRADPRR